MTGAVRNLCQMYQGLFQDPGQPTGMDHLFGRLKVDVPTLDVWPPMNWTSNAADDLARNVRHLSTDHTHSVGGYSLGGYLAVDYCRRADDEGAEIDFLFLLDAVWRMKVARWGWATKSASVWSHWLPKPVRPVLWITPNVKFCVVVRQRNNYPRGHEVLPTKNNTRTQFKFITSTKNHVGVDNDPIAHNYIVEYLSHTVI